MSPETMGLKMACPIRIAYWMGRGGSVRCAFLVDEMVSAPIPGVLIQIVQIGLLEQIQYNFK